MQRTQISRLLALVPAVVALLVSAAGCIHTVNPAKIAPPYKVTVYEHGAYSPEHVFTADSAEGKQISAWIESHRSGWSLSIDSYAPYRLIRGEQFMLNFGRRLCILNYRGGLGNRWTQVTRQIEERDFPAVFHRSQ